MPQLAVCVLLLALGVFGSKEFLTSDLKNENRKLLAQKVYLTLDKMLDFFSEDYSSINLDGLYGLRLGQGQIISALDECEKRSCDPKLNELLKNMVSRLEDTCSKALPYVEQSDSKYFKRFEYVVAEPYILPYKRTMLHPPPGFHIGFKTDYDEERGDACYSRIMGTFLEGNNPVPKCNITDDCLAYMTQNDTAQYFITHQLLYFITVEHMGCSEAVQAFIGSRRIFDIQRSFCEKIYPEAQSFVKDGNVDGTNKDLFLEQVDLCGSLGFENFMNTDWIRMVLKWPDSTEGCFKFGLSQVDEMVMELVNELQQAEGRTLSPSDIKQFQSEAEEGFEKENQSTFRGNRRSMRKLLREKAMKDGCLAHTSGLGFSAFCVYLRYLLLNF
ncbi:hypothetical protein ACJMK2_012149 [Sinanodonta woodiana]|uniref:Uncharacterized protein n=1 Tax=Sinanodonta woodiana TaxID=1069815 RepID=A0ABD3V794_SINWO